MEKIANIKDYNTAMKKTLLDKIWWIDKIDKSITTIFDFGCADGSMTKFIDEMFPNRFNFVLIDNDAEMLKLAEQNLKYKTNVRFYADLNIALQYNLFDLKKSVLVLNSVMHEVLSYCTEEEQNKLFKDFFNGFGYIAIRDMHLNDFPIFGCVLSAEHQRKIAYTSQNIKHKDYKSTLVEYFLKSEYINNWEREKDERYLWDWSRIIFLNWKNKYEIMHEEDFSLVYHRKIWRKEFQISLSDLRKFKTHKKLLLKSIDI